MFGQMVKSSDSINEVLSSILIIIIVNKIIWMDKVGH
jgi:hypothetical protein